MTFLPWKPEHKGTNGTAKIRGPAFKNILGWQIIISVLAISTIHIYSDNGYPFLEGCLLLEPWEDGIRALPLCLYRTLGWTLRNPWLSPGSWPLHGQMLVTVLFCLLKCLMTKVLSIPDVGEVWSPVMISLRDVHPSSHMRVSPTSNNETLLVCGQCLLESSFTLV